MLHEIERFVLRPDQAVPLSRDGFLCSLNDTDRWLTEPQPRNVKDLIVPSQSFVLLAAGGVGKTTTLRMLAKLEPKAQYIDTVTLSLVELRSEIKKAEVEGHPLYLDALDQAGTINPSLYRILEEVLTKPTARYGSWRLGCRAAAWRPSLSGALSSELATFEELKLLPLDKISAQELVAAERVDGQAFIEALVGAGLGRLSASPQQLCRLARYWGQNGRLPETSLEAIDWEVDYLLQETSDGVPPRLARDRAGRIAERMGAFATFSGVYLLSAGIHGEPKVVSLADLPGEPDPEDYREVSPSDYHDVAGTALFDAGSVGTVMFRHQQYAEYLAARYLVRRDVSQAQIPSLLGVHPNGLLPTERIGVAAWLASLRPELVVKFLKSNAVMFAASPVELTSDSCRALVVEGLLEQAAADDLDPHWEIDLSSLAHAGLADLLQARMDSGPASSSQLLWIARLAEAGECRSLCASLSEAARRSSYWDNFARRAVVGSVTSLGSEDDLRDLSNMLHEPPTSDPDDEILGTLIHTLYPAILNARDIVSVLRPRQAPYLIGRYLIALDSLANRIPETDLPLFLAWASTNCHSMAEMNGYSKLIPSLVYRAWEAEESDELRSALSILLASLGRAGWLITNETHQKTAPWAGGDVLRRRRLVLAVAEALSRDTWYLMLTLRLLYSEDAEWLLDELQSLEPGPARILVICIPFILQNPTADLADQVLEMASSHRAYEATQRFRGSVEVGSEIAGRRSVGEAEETEYRQDHAERVDQARIDLKAALREIETDIGWWPKVVYLLGIGEGDGDHIDINFNFDLTLRPGWQPLNLEEQESVLRAGLRYISSHTPAVDRWSASTTITLDYVQMDWSGVYLLATLAKQNRQMLADLDIEVWERWAAAIVSVWDAGENDLRLQVIESAPRSVMVQASLDRIDILDASGQPLMPHSVYEDLATDLASEVAQRLVVGRYSSEIGIDLLEIMVKRVPVTALSVCRTLSIESDAQLAKHAKRHLALLDPNGIVERWMATPPRRDELIDMASFLRVGVLSQEDLLTVARLLLGVVPYGTDPMPEAGFRGVDPLDGARSTRNEALRRLADLGACDEIASLRTGDCSPSDEYMLRYHERIARARRADISIGTTSPRYLLEMLRHGDARLVRNGNDLLLFLIEQLDKLQHQISENGAFRDLWNGDKPKSEDDVSDWIRRNLDGRINRNLVIDREVQVLRRRDHGIGTRIDLTATAPIGTQPSSMARVTIEAKLVGNDELASAMIGQLVQRYLLPGELTHGIYLVYWIRPDQRPSSWSRRVAPTVDRLYEELSVQAGSIQKGLRVVPYVLDFSRPVD